MKRIFGLPSIATSSPFSPTSRLAPAALPARVYPCESARWY
jgi:hypothetical protein